MKHVAFESKVMYAIKHRSANHETRNGFYNTRDEVEKVFLTIPPSHASFRGHVCEGCSVGCRDEYEIIEVLVQLTEPFVIRKVPVTPIVRDDLFDNSEEIGVKKGV